MKVVGFSLLLGGLIGGAALAVACGGSDLLLPGDSQPAAVAIVQGNNQSAPVGEALAEALVVRVTDASGRPVAQTGVTFVLGSEGGSVSPANTTTTTEGTARARWVLGSTAGAQTLDARVSGGGPSATFTAFAAAGTAARLELVKGDAQTAPVGTMLPESLVVRAADAAGNPVEGVGVTWAVEGGGSVSAEALATGPDGRAGVRRTLGPAAGQQATIAAAGALAPITFTATATTGAAGKLTIVQQPSPNATIGLAFARQPRLQLLDALNNPVRQAGMAVTAAIASGPAAGVLQGQLTQATDAEGVAAFSDLAIDGSGGSFTLRFTGAGLAEAVSSAITVNTGGVSAARSTLEATPDTIVVFLGTSSITVTALDGLGFPIQGASVSPSTGDGGRFDPASAVTESDGQAVFTFRATATGTYVVSAKANDVAIEKKDTILVTRLPTTTTITSDLATPTQALSDLTIAWAVTSAAAAAPTGTVTVSEAGTARCSAPVQQGECTFKPQTAGLKTYTATYSGDANFLPSSDMEDHTVRLVPTTTDQLSSSRPDAHDSETVTLSARVTALAGPLSGTLTFAQGVCGQPVASGATRNVSTSGTTTTVTWSTKNLPVGTYTIIACFNANATFDKSESAPITQTVSDRR